MIEPAELGAQAAQVPQGLLVTASMEQAGRFAPRLAPRRRKVSRVIQVEKRQADDALYSEHCQQIEPSARIGRPHL